MAVDCPQNLAFCYAGRGAPFIERVFDPGRDGNGPDAARACRGDRR
jgi:hypothetical protein